MDMNKGLKIAAVALILIVVASACKPTPAPSTIDILGDSITQQAYWDRDDEFDAQGRPAGSDVVMDAWMGNQFHDVQERETARVFDPEQPRPEIMVIALGVNNAMAWTNYWTASDANDFDALLATPHATTCVVVILPGVAYKPTTDQRTRDSVSKARSHMKTQAIARQGQGSATVVVDWGALARAHPDYTDTDGVHLPDTEVAKDRYAKIIWDGVHSCPA